MQYDDLQRQELSESRLRLQTTVRLRWFAVAGQLIAIAFVSLGLGSNLPVGACLALIALSAWINVYLRLRYPARHRLSVRLSRALLAYDTCQLAALLYLTGGIENPFMSLIIAPVTVAAATLRPRDTIALGALAAIFSFALNFWHYDLPWPQGGAFNLPPLYRWGILAGVLCAMLFQALYAWRLSKESRLMSAALVATEHVLAREQQLHALDGLAAAAAHELGTPLSTITVVAKELAKSPAVDAAMAEDLALLQSQAIRCREILQKLTRSPNERDPLHAMLTVTQLIEEAAAPYRAYRTKVVMSAAPAEGSANSPEPVGERRPGVIYGVGNILENAVDFARERVEVTARWSDATVVVTISDDGPGFPTDLLDSLGEPYVTTRSARLRGANSKEPGERELGDRSGLGLGFFIAKTLLERSGATVTLENKPRAGTGAIVRINWPRSAYQSASPVFGRRAPDAAMPLVGS